MGGSAIGGDLAAAALGERLSGPLLTMRGYGLPSWADPGVDGALFQLLGRDRGDARLLRGGRGAWRAPDRRRHGGGLVDGPARGVPVIGLPGILRSRAPPSPTCLRPRPRSPPWPAPLRASHRDRGGRRLLSERAEDLPSRAAEIAECPREGRAGGLRRRPHGAGRAALEDPGEREREAARLLLGVARGRPQRDMRLGRGLGSLAAVLLEDATSIRAWAAFRADPRRWPTPAPCLRWRPRGDPGRAYALGDVLGDLVSVELAEARGVDAVPVEAIETSRPHWAAPDASRILRAKKRNERNRWQPPPQITKSPTSSSPTSDARRSPSPRSRCPA